MEFLMMRQISILIFRASMLMVAAGCNAVLDDFNKVMDSDSDVDNGTETTSDPTTQTVTDGDTDTVTDMGIATETNSDTDTDTATDTDTGADTDTDTNPDSDTSLEKVEDTGTGTDTDSDSDWATDSDTQTDTGTGVDTGEDTGADSETDTDTQTDSGTEVDTGEDTGADTGADSETDTDSDSDIPGDCTASVVDAGDSVSGTGPYAVVVETNADEGINEGTIYRPAELYLFGGQEKLPIFVWGEGACSLNGRTNSEAMAEIASHGYFVIADGTPGGDGSRNTNTEDLESMGAPLRAYMTWAITENYKPCSAYYHRLDTEKVAANGWSCGGWMAAGTAGDPRITTWGFTSSGTVDGDQRLYNTIHTPVLLVEGGTSDMAYQNGLRDYNNISQDGIPILFISKDLGHGGDLNPPNANGGDFTRINLAWLNWWLKGDETETGKGLLVGATCPYCADSDWEVLSANLE